MIILPIRRNDAAQVEITKLTRVRVLPPQRGDENSVVVHVRVRAGTRFCHVHAPRGTVSDAWLDDFGDVRLAYYER